MDAVAGKRAALSQARQIADKRGQGGRCGSACYAADYLRARTDVQLQLFAAKRESPPANQTVLQQGRCVRKDRHQASYSYGCGDRLLKQHRKFPPTCCVATFFHFYWTARPCQWSRLPHPHTLAGSLYSLAASIVVVRRGTGVAASSTAAALLQGATWQTGDALSQQQDRRW
jgi:hypothetical protein